MKQIKLILALLITAVLAVVLVQNSGPAQVSVLFWHAQMPLIVLLALVAALGILIGMFLQMGLGRGKTPK